jgi:hypothetical protein
MGIPEAQKMRGKSRSWKAKAYSWRFLPGRVY